MAKAKGTLNGTGGRLRGLFARNVLKSAEEVMAERLAERKAHEAALVEALQEEARIPALNDALTLAAKTRDEAMTRHDEAVAKARIALDAARSSASRKQSRAELALRRSCDSLISDSGPVVWRLIDLRQHMLPHCSIEQHERYWINDVRRGAVKVSERNKQAFEALQVRAKIADETEALIGVLDEALAAVRDLQLVADPNLPEALAEILAPLPERCLCGAAIDFSPAADEPSPIRRAVATVRT